MKDTYIINADGNVEQVNYQELVWQYVDTTTTPGGVAPRLHVREKTWYKVGNGFDNLSETKEEAEDRVSDIAQDTGKHLEIEEVTRYEGWTWGHQGNFPQRRKVFDSREEADEWLFLCAEMDFQKDCNAPLIFKTQAEAENWLKENANVQEPS